MKIMKLLYIAPTKIEMEQLDGVAKKILGHVKVFAKVYDVMLLYRDAENVVLYRVKDEEFKFIGRGSSKFDILRAAFTVIQQIRIDYCYIRYPNSDPIFLSLLKKMKKKGIRIVIEIPTYPYDSEGKETIKGRIIHFIDVIYRKKLHHYVGRIVTYSEDDSIFGIKTIKTVNGLDFEKVRIAKAVPIDSIIHLCGVATFHQIHGYDRLIKGLCHYYQNGGTREIVFDVVGYGDNKILQEYKKMAKIANIEDRVVFHGRLNGSELDDIYDKATIGVNSLAIHRQNLTRESTLKTREYAAKGLPILSSSFVDAFDKIDNTKFVCLIPPDDTPINIEDVIRFYDNLSSFEENESLRRTIRTKSRSICDMPVTLKPIIIYLNGESKIPLGVKAIFERPIPY